MALHIRNPRAAELARKLAAKRRQTMTEAVIAALESELRRAAKRRSLGQRLEEIAEELAAKADPALARRVTKEESDVLWDQG